MSSDQAPATGVTATASGDHPDLVVARAVAGAVRDLPGVADLDGMVGDVFATWRRGGRQVGVRLDRDRPDHAAIRVVAASPTDVVGLGDRVRAAAVAATDRLAHVDVHIADVRVHGADLDAPSTAELLDRPGATPSGAPAS